LGNDWTYHQEGAKMDENKISDALGFAPYFHVEWAIAKVVDAVAAIIPRFWQRIREFAYHGDVFRTTDIRSIDRDDQPANICQHCQEHGGLTITVSGANHGNI
jgi:hypothetical protein